MLTAEEQNNANLAKLKQLVQDAQAKSDEATQNRGTTYWLGVKDGLLRSITVLEGRG